MSVTVLMVDDDADDREFFRDAMASVSQSIECVCEANFRHTLSNIEQGLMSLPDIFFLDINMPVMDGWMCLQQIKQSHYANIPIVMCSTSSDPKDIAKAKQLGAAYFLIKPDSFPNFVNSLKIILVHAAAGTLQQLKPGFPLSPESYH